MLSPQKKFHIPCSLLGLSGRNSGFHPSPAVTVYILASTLFISISLHSLQQSFSQNASPPETNNERSTMMERIENSQAFSTWEKLAAEAVANEKLDLPRVDEMNDKQHEALAKRYLMINLMKGGTPTREAIERAGLEITASAGRKLLKRFEQYGVQGLVDQRIRNKRVEVLTFEIKKRVLAWWFARSAAGPRAIWKEIVKECQERKIKVPGYDTVKKYIESLPEAYKLFREGKLSIHEWERSFCPVVRFDLTSYSNQRWQIDNSRLDIWVRVKDGDRWVPAQAHICACICAHSRSIPGLVLSAKDPDAWTTALLIMNAVAPKENPDWKNKGMPFILQPDRGKTFLAHAVVSSLAYMGVALDPDPPYYPNRKGKMERWFLTLDRGCLRILPGHMDAIGRTHEAAENHVDVLLTIPQLRKEIERWVVTDYHQQTHSETGRKPAELWEETVRLHIPESEDALHLMLLKSDRERTVYNTGINFRFGDSDVEEKRIYWAPELIYHIGERVRLRYNPEDRESILVYSSATNTYICEAWLMGEEDSRYTIEDVKRTRNEFRRGLQERMKDYREEIEVEDRKRAQTAEWSGARLVADKQEEADQESAGGAVADDLLLDDLLDRFNCQDSGETGRDNPDEEV
jgi:putative transposase